MEQTTAKAKEWCNVKMNGGNASTGAVYFFGLIGAAIYYLQTATTFIDGLIGILKAFVWPALIVYHLFQYFNF